MTREEAIKRLSKYVHNSCYTIEYQEACAMAIAALKEQETVTIAHHLEPVTLYMTNADHIRSMTDEDLAETIVREFCAVSDNTVEFIVAKTRFRLWLKQPYKEST